MALIILALPLGSLSGAVAETGSAGDATTFYDWDVQKRGLDSLKKGDVEGAVSTFCTMFTVPKGTEVWTLSLVLVCDADDVWGLAKQVTDLRPVFVQLREFQGKRCYRVCAGLATSRAEASKWIGRVPDGLKTQGPFPVRVVVPCPPPASSGTAPISQAPAPEAKPATPSPGPAPAQAEPPSPVPTGAEPSPPPPKSRESEMWFVPPKPLPPSTPDAAKEAEAWFQKGLAAYQEGRRMDAYEYYNNALALDPGRPEILNNLGVLYLEERQYAQAQTLFSKAVDRAPTYARARLNLAGALWGLKYWDEAITQARLACDQDKKDVNGRLTLTSFLLAQGRREEAAATAREALAIDPQNAQAKVFLESAEATPKHPKGES